MKLRSLVRQSSWSLIVLGAVACSAAGGSASEPGEPGSGTLPQSAGVYRYVLASDPASTRSLTGGAHEVIVPVDRDKADKIDDANRPSRLHPKLGEAEYQKYDPSLTQGEMDFKVFPSSWWAQSNDGIAKRWTGGEQDRSKLADTENLAPVEKYDVLFHPGQQKQVAAVEHWEARELAKPEAERGTKHKHEAVTVAGPATKWELENHGLYQTFAHPDSWWGHCNGWSSYATLETEPAPARDIRVKLDPSGKIYECDAGEADCTLFRMGDIEALFTELYFSDKATFAGRRCNVDPDKIERDEHGRPKQSECRDLNPGSFHIGVTGLLSRGATYLNDNRPGKPPFVIDHNWDWEVWNFPLVKYQVLEQQEVSKEDAAKLVASAAREYVWNAEATKFVRVKLKYWMVSDGVGDGEMLKNAYLRGTSPHETELNYVLELNDGGTILGGEWIQSPSTTWGEDNKKLHPDFFWMAVRNDGYGESPDDLGGDDDNPFVSYSKVKMLAKCANDKSTCAKPAVNPGTGGAGGTSGAGGSGGAATDGGTTTDSGAAGGPQSCLGNCGKKAAGGCWCDANCAKYGDCCADLQTACGGTVDGGAGGAGGTGGASGTGGSAAGGTGGGSAFPGCTAALCGTSTSSKDVGTGKACYCDATCATYGDCCTNKTSVCGS